MHWVLKDKPDGRKTRLYIPLIPSLLFVKSSKSDLDEAVGKIETLQYRYVKGAPQNTPMIVPLKEMEEFMRAVGSAKCCTFYAPDEISTDKIGRKVMIEGGELNGITGNLLKMQGSKKKRLILKLDGFLAATIEVESDFIRFI